MSVEFLEGDHESWKFENKRSTQSMSETIPISHFPSNDVEHQYY